MDDTSVKVINANILIPISEDVENIFNVYAKSLKITLEDLKRERKERKKEIEIEPMVLAVTLNPSKHADIIKYLLENVEEGGRSEWIRDAIRLKMRLEEGTFSQGGMGGITPEFTFLIQALMGQIQRSTAFGMAETNQGMMGGSPMARPPTSQPNTTTGLMGASPALKKVEGAVTDDFKPDRPSLDDVIDDMLISAED